MTSLRGKEPHTAVLGAEPVRAHLRRIPGRSQAQRVLPCGRALSPVRVALLAAVYFRHPAAFRPNYYPSIPEAKDLP